MELPLALRMALDRALSGVPLHELEVSAAALSERYRSDKRSAAPYVVTRQDALAYIATRLPATYAAVRAAFAATADACPDFAPCTALDIGAGPGTALWAAANCWPALEEVTLVEASPVFLALGQQLAAGADLPRGAWQAADITTMHEAVAPRDLVAAAYVLNELKSGAMPRVVERLWQATAGMLVIVEPGTPVGWQHILAARAQLIEAGGHVVAPCPHQCACPLHSPDWCHFAQRVARSRQHRLAKGAELPWEDEKFSYVAVSRHPAGGVGVSRVIARPRKASGRAELKLCCPDGTARQAGFSRRDGDTFKRARRTRWGDAIEYIP